MRSKKYILVGNPIPWKRPGRNKNLYYDAQKLHKENIARELHFQHNKEPLFNPPIRIDYKFFFEIPKSFSRPRQQALKNTWLPKDPDKTNVEKFYEDCACGVLFKDDNEIVCGYQEKRYDDGNGPRVEMEIWEIK